MACPERRTKGRQGGFTLIEMMVVVIIVALLLTVGVPSLMSTIRRNSVSSKLNELLGAMQIARSTAVTRNSRVSFCYMDAADSEACDAAGSLADGWIVFTDPDGDAAVDAGEEIVATSANVADEFEYAFTDADGNAVTSLTFGAMGTASVIGTLTVCRGDDYAGEIALGPTGRATTSKLDACP